MCRNIKTLFNFEPPATELEIRDASLQFVRKLSGFNVPSKANEAAFERAVEEVAASARKLIQSLVTSSEPRTREAEASKLDESPDGFPTDYLRTATNVMVIKIRKGAVAGPPGRGADPKCSGEVTGEPCLVACDPIASGGRSNTRTALAVSRTA